MVSAHAVGVGHHLSYRCTTLRLDHLGRYALQVLQTLEKSAVGSIAPQVEPVYLHLSATEPEAAAALCRAQDGPHCQELALTALNIGIRSLKAARGNVVVANIRQEGDRLLGTLEERMVKLGELLDDTTRRDHSRRSTLRGNDSESRVGEHLQPHSLAADDVFDSDSVGDKSGVIPCIKLDDFVVKMGPDSPVGRVRAITTEG